MEDSLMLWPWPYKLPVGEQGVLFYVDLLVTVFFGNTEEELT